MRDSAEPISTAFAPLGIGKCRGRHLTHVDRPESLSQMIRCQRISHTSKCVEQSIFVAKDWSRADNSRFWKDVPRNLFSTGLGEWA